MAITKQQAQSAMKRLRALPFSEDEAVRREVGQALESHAKDTEHAARIVDALMDRLHRYPTRADVIETAMGTRQGTDEYYDPRKPRCEQCDGTGFVIVKRGEIEAAAPCECRKVTAAGGGL